MKRASYVGLRFGGMLVIGEAPQQSNYTRWRCRCETCGVVRSMESPLIAHYRAGRIKSVTACAACRPKHLSPRPSVAPEVRRAKQLEYVRRHRSRKREQRAASLSQRGSRLEVFQQGLLIPTPEHDRPRTRGDCVNGPRPCPFVSCRWHLYLDVNPSNGTLKLNFPDIEPHDLAESCCLDVADRGGIPLEAAGTAMNITRERVRQLEERAVAHVTPLLEGFR